MNDWLNTERGTETHHGGIEESFNDETISALVLSSGECVALTEQVEAKCLAQSSSTVHSSWHTWLQGRCVQAALWLWNSHSSDSAEPPPPAAGWHNQSHNKHEGPLLCVFPCDTLALWALDHPLQPNIKADWFILRAYGKSYNCIFSYNTANGIYCEIIFMFLSRIIVQAKKI